MSMIFQDPTSSLNPVIPIAHQFREVLSRATPGITRDAAHTQAAEALREVAITEADRVLASYPFQLSGGMNQRVMIAMALANRPKLVVADEPGTALDVTVQAQTLDLMHRLVADHGTAVLFISHNLGVVREFADRTYVIYRGRIVETGPTAAVFANPRHAYTRALMSAQPRLTAAGLPDIPERDPAFNDPVEVHP
jgi:ABC-type dipeptide/oligopeptide/nickel transport system ATPase component